MIEILASNGDRAEAETPEAALLAARTLLDEHAAASFTSTRDATVAFFVDGALVRTVDRQGLR